MKAILIKNFKQLVRNDKKAHENGYKWTSELICNKPQNLKKLDLPCYLIIADVFNNKVLYWCDQAPLNCCVDKEEEFI